MHSHCSSTWCFLMPGMYEMKKKRLIPWLPGKHKKLEMVSLTQPWPALFFAIRVKILMVLTLSPQGHGT